MSKNCANCGQLLEDDAVFCANCGARADEQQTAPTAPTTSAASENGIAGKINGFIGKLKNKDGKAIGIVAGAVAVIIALIVVVVLLSGGGPEAALEKYIDVMFNGDIDDLEELAPKKYWDVQEDENDASISDFEEQYELIYDHINEALEEEYGNDIKVKVKVTDKKDAPKATLKAMQEYLKEEYNISKSSVSTAVKLNAELTIKGDDDKDTDDVKFYAVKVDGDWYICSESGEFLSIDSSMF